MADERTLVADIKSYIDELDNGFKAEVEEHPEGSITRVDLIVRYNNQILFNGEFKRPYTLEGKNPRAADLVDDAFLKSSKLSTPSRFFITSNFNETVIWDNKEQDRPLMSRDIETIKLSTQIKTDEDFRKDYIKSALKETFQSIAKKILEFYQGIKKTEYKRLDESFILGLNSHLNAAVDTAFKYVSEPVLRKWWREQNYEPVDKFGEEEKRRISRFSLYVLANKIVFYYVLKRSFENLNEITFSESAGINEIKESIFSAFENAKRLSGDYETVFEKSDADLIPFSSEDMAYHIRNLIKFFKLYNFSTLSQDILGNIYDTLISPGERHDNGQYFTPIPVVDLINALTIKKPDANVLDPACGSGTFLTRAFDLKLNLLGKDNKKTREKIISELFGVDIASYPAHLATIALASKLSVQNPRVYPNIIRSDFLDVKPNIEQPMFMMHEHRVKTLSGKKATIKLKQLDAIVSNLPYIRQEDIQNKEEEQIKVKNGLEQYGFSPEKPNNTSDFHVYFWYYILPFLKEGSRVGFLTSDTWLNVDYGDDLKRFINKYFKIIAIIDSSVERYFPDALVNTVITILERTNDKNAIKNNKIKFVRMNKKIGELIKNLDDAQRIASNIEEGKNSEGVQIIREIKQGDLNFNDKMKAKLFPYLRAPDEFFELVNNKNMVPLEKVMDIQRGFTTGANEFFYVEDVSKSYSEDKLKRNWGLNKSDLKFLRVIRDGTGQEHIIEKEYLKSILKSPREFTKEGRLIFKGKTQKYVVLINESNKMKIKEYARKYISYGERQGYNNRPTCKSRPYWWKLSPIIYPDLVFTMYFSSNFIYPKTDILLDHAMYFGKIKENYKNDLLMIYSFMNSSLSYLYPDLYGRNYGGGAVGFMIYEVQKLPVPNPEVLKQYYKEIGKIMNKMENRRIGSVFEEIWNGEGEFRLENVKKDRLELDRLLLHALGFDKPDQFLIGYYQYIVKIVKERLSKAESIKHSNKTRRANLSKIAEQILNSIQFKKFPEDYIKNTKIEKQ
ncbi:MAG: HsdM family class I SAM-dependent methyltransferase, partial [Fervidicoccus sp.]